MKGKLSTKTIIITIIAILLFAVAATGTVIFLKDSGEASAAVEDRQETRTLPNTGSEETTENNNDQNTEEINMPEEQNDATDDQVATNANNNQQAIVANNNQQAATAQNQPQTEPAPTTVERERVVAESVSLGWNNANLNAQAEVINQISNLSINYQNLTYRVEYYFDGVLAEDLTDVIESNEKGKVIETYEDKMAIGYKLDNVENLPLTISENEENNVIKVNYVKDASQTKALSYTVKYYLDNAEQIDDEVIKTETVWVNEPDTLNFDTELLNKEYTGYQKTSTDPETVENKVANGTEIKVYYEKDESQTKTLSYTVRYYLDNVEQKDDKVERTKTVWVNDPDTLNLDSELLNKEYIGYQKISTNPEVVGDTVANSAEIKVYYEKDKSQTKTLSYTVEYYLDNVEQKDDKVEKTKTVWVNEPDTLEFDSTLLNKKYTGYKKTSTSPATVGKTVANGAVIKVYYIKDSTKTKQASYTVEYYQDGVKTETETITKDIWVNDTQISVDSTKINTTNKYAGYQFDHTDPATMPTTIEVGGVIKVYYVKDTTKTKQASYTVEYYKDGVKADEETITETVWVNDTKVPVITSKINTTNKFEGYNFSYTNPHILPETIDAEEIIKVYYVKDTTKTKQASYTVEYYKDGVKADEETITEDIWVNDTKVPVMRSKINIKDKYTGYQFDHTDPTTIPTTIEVGGIIKVYYAKDTTKIKEASYTVEYYKDGVKADEETITENIWVNDTQIPVDSTKINITDKYPGYQFDHTNPATIPTTIKVGGVIKVYYVSKIANITVSKTASKKGSVQPGDIITYTLSATNNSDWEGTTIIADEIPEGTKLSGSITATGVTKPISVDDLKKGITIKVKPGKDTAKVEFSVEVLSSGFGKEIKNTAYYDQNKPTEEVVNKVTKSLEVTANVGVKQQKGLNYIIMIDASSSMYPAWNGWDDRIGRAKSAVKSFMNKVFDETPSAKVTIVRFGYKADFVGTYDKNSNINNIDIKMYPMNTDIKAGLEKGAEYKVNSTKNVMILLSDGAPYEYGLGLIGYPHYNVETNADNIAKVARNIESDKNTEIYCIGFGKDANKPDKDAYKVLSKISNNGNVLTSNETDELISNFDEIIYSSIKSETLEVENSLKEFNLGVKQLDPSRKVTITYDGGNEEYTFNNLGTQGPLTYSKNENEYKLTFDITNYLSKNNLQIKYYAK